MRNTFSHRRWRRRSLASTVAVSGAALALALAISISSATAATGKNTLKITGPTANVYHTYFNETVSGNAISPANYVVSGEQLNPAGGCASTFVKERQKGGFGLWGTVRNRPGGTGPVHGHFTTVARFWARNHMEHGICSYLINRGTLKTYAHASRWWNNS